MAAEIHQTRPGFDGGSAQAMMYTNGVPQMKTSTGLSSFTSAS